MFPACLASLIADDRSEHLAEAAAVSKFGSEMGSWTSKPTSLISVSVLWVDLEHGESGETSEIRTLHPTLQVRKLFSSIIALLLHSVVLERCTSCVFICAVCQFLSCLPSVGNVG